MSRVEKINIFYTTCIFINHFAFGISSNVMWPALVDLQNIYGVDYDVISYIVTCSSLGYLLGSLSGLAYRWVNRQLTLSVMCIVLAITISLVPHYSHLWLLFTALVFNGLGGGCWDSSNNIWLVDIWKSNNGPIMQASQFMYGLGTIVGPVIVSPFVHGEDHDNNKTIEDYPPEKLVHDLSLPFIIVGAIQIIIPLLFFISFLVKPFVKEPETPRHVRVAEQCDYVGVQAELTLINASSTTSNRRTKIALMALILALYDAAEIGYFYFSPSLFMLAPDIKMESSTAAHLSSVLSAAYTFGRLVSTFISIKIKPDIIIAYHFLIIFAGHSLLYLFRTDLLMVYVATVIIGLGFSAMWPAILAFTDRHLKLTDRVGTILFCTAGVVSLFTPTTIGPFLDKTSRVFNPLMLFAFEMVYIGISFVVYVLFNLVVLRYF